MEYVINFGEVNYFVDMIKMFFIILYTYCIAFKIINQKNFKNSKIFILIIFIALAVISKIIKNIYGYLYSIIYLDFLVAILFSKLTKNNIGYSILITTMSLSISYIVFFVSLGISFFPNIVFNINNSFISLFIIIFIYTILVYIMLKIKRVTKGLLFLKDKFNTEVMDILILNISITILFTVILLSNYERMNTRVIGTSFIIFSIIMFVSIQKSLQLYYKQKLQEREVEEIKEELKNREKEIKELENENLKLNKKNHSIAHKQKSLEHELKELLANNQIINKNNIKDKIEDLSKEMQNETISVELAKTNIEEIDSMLKYMQSECMKNKIDFQLQLNGNIHHMVNTYIEKEDLEILIADMIKNALIAINNSKNINKGILVRLGLIDGKYSLYIYDSGIEFEIDTLINLGIKPSTTHSNDGGTGMGWMNTFDTLKKYKASLVIDEYGKPVEDNFTKVIKIIFDNENTYKINSYREKEIKKEDSENRINLINRLYK